MNWSKFLRSRDDLLTKMVHDQNSRRQGATKKDRQEFVKTTVQLLDELYGRKASGLEIDLVVQG